MSPLPIQVLVVCKAWPVAKLELDGEYEACWVLYIYVYAFTKYYFNCWTFNEWALRTCMLSYQRLCWGQLWCLVVMATLVILWSCVEYQNRLSFQWPANCSCNPGECVRRVWVRVCLCDANIFIDLTVLKLTFLWMNHSRATFFICMVGESCVHI